MRKFQFQFETVEKMRKLREQEALRVLSSAQKLLMAARDFRLELGRKLDGGLLRREELGSRGVTIPALPFQLENEFIIGTKQRILQAEQAVLRAVRVVEKAMRAYLQTRRQSKMIEVLREKARVDYKRERVKWEQRQLDDLITMRARLRPGHEGEGAA